MSVSVYLSVCVCVCVCVCDYMSVFVSVSVSRSMPVCVLFGPRSVAVSMSAPVRVHVSLYFDMNACA